MTLQDPFGITEGTVSKPTALCNPVDKNSEGIIDPTAHLTCYRVLEAAGTLQLPEIAVQAEVVWVKPPNKIDLDYRIGLKFTKLSRMARAAIEEYIHQSIVEVAEFTAQREASNSDTSIE